MDEHPFDRFVEALKQKGVEVRRTGRTDQVRACCPAHNDRLPSLVVTRIGDIVCFKCFSGCHWRNVLAALGLNSRDLFSVARTSTSLVRREVAVYPYRDELGRPVAEKVRMEPKGFYFRLPGKARGGGLRGVQLGLYRAERVRGEVDLFVAEGEKAVERLTAIGLAAVCPPYGAGSWHERFTAQVFSATRRLVVILADADKQGRNHALRVAEACYSYKVLGTTARPTIKLVELDGVPPRGDVVDWLDAGHTAEELRAVVDRTPKWTPTLKSEMARARRLHFGRERSQRWRDRHHAKKQGGR